MFIAFGHKHDKFKAGRKIYTNTPNANLVGLRMCSVPWDSNLLHCICVYSSYQLLLNTKGN